METHRMIRDVVEKDEFRGLITSWAAHLCDTDIRFLQRRLDDLKTCTIERISHCRQAGFIAHECIVVHIRAGPDKRVARLERFKELTHLRTSAEQAVRLKHEFSGHETGNHDNLAIAYNLEDIINLAKENDNSNGSAYHLVQTAAVPDGSMTILHCAALALAIGEVAKDYSVFHHMCMWWASMFFQVACLRHEIPLESVQTGSAYQQAGKIAGVPFVNRNAQLVFAFEHIQTVGNVLGAAKNESALFAALQADFDRLGGQEHHLLSAAQQMLVQAKIKENEIREKMDKALAEWESIEGKAHENALAVHAAQRQAREAEIKAQHAEQKAEHAEQKARQEAEARATAEAMAATRIATLEAQLEQLKFPTLK
ncbi:hypothetical protein R3P38DRAFT_2710661 [Favolaschia claudopus]|uniref:Uncharacterized protein n=1 Tax=Favolaschia claudopus TaxID=2862362 RepID=A0AAW0B7N0_9AGAR